MRHSTVACTLLAALFLPVVSGGEAGAPPVPVAAASTGVAWNADGHRIVCQIAWREMGTQTRAAVRRLLQADPDRESFPDGCVWPDRIRGLLRDGLADYERFALYDRAHYMNTPPGAPGVDLAGCTVILDAGRRAPCVVDAIAEFSDSLVSSASPQHRLEALKWLGHLVADIHQPLHSAYAADRGGNDVLVNLMGESGRNLHAVWDGFFIEHRGLPWREYAALLGGEIRPIDRSLWAKGGPVDWANESYQLTETEVYALLSEGRYVGQLYFDRHIDTVERRLKQAGFRLARWLERLLR